MQSLQLAPDAQVRLLDLALRPGVSYMTLDAVISTRYAKNIVIVIHIAVAFPKMSLIDQQSKERAFPSRHVTVLLAAPIAAHLSNLPSRPLYGLS